MKTKHILFQSLFILVLLFLIPSCAVNPVTGKKQLMLMSSAQEDAIGAQYHPQVIANFGIYEDEKLSKLLNERAAEMAKISHRPDLEFKVTILDSPVVNAFAVPGGYLYFTRGILAHFNNEAELVGVLGHEMGHVTARHTASQQSKQQLGQILLIGGMIASEKFRQFGEYAMQGMQLLFLKFSRDAESQADELGVEYSSKIGFDAHKMANFFAVLKAMQLQSESGGVPTFMSTHPDPGDRYVQVNREAEIWQDSLKRGNWLVEREPYLRMIDGIVYGEDPRQGFVEKGVFYHPELKFRFPVPVGWTLQNSPMQVQMAPRDGGALMIFTMAQGNSLQEAAQKTVKDLNLTVQDSKSTTVNGMPASLILSTQTSQDQQTGQTQTLKVLSYLIQYNNQIYLFHGVTDEAVFNNFFRLFESTMSNFNQLTDPSKLNVQPKRIRIQEVQRDGKAADIFAQYGTPQNMIEEVALLNEITPEGTINKGALIKLIK